MNDLLWRMDLVYERDHGSRKLGEQLTANMSMRPSEYFDRNCFIGASNIIRVEMARRYEIGVGNLCWGNDFPHPEGTWPHTREFLAKVFCDIPRDETAAMLGRQRGRGLRLRRRSACSRSSTASGRRPRSSARPTTRRAKWADAKRAGRPWLTGIETWPGAARLTRDDARPTRVRFNPFDDGVRRVALRAVRAAARRRSRSTTPNCCTGGS